MSQSVAVAVAASALVLASLAACGGPQAAAPAEQRHCVALAVHVGMLGRDALAEQLRMALRPLARTGGTLTVWRATRSAASLDPIIRQQEVFAPIGEEERVAAGAETSVTTLVDQMLEAAVETGKVPATVVEAEPVDLFGALRAMGAKAATMGGCGHKKAVLVTGGGINRTKELDLLNVPGRLTAAVAGKLSTPVVTAPSGVTQAVYGTGNFEQVTPEVDDDFAQAIVIVWKKACECVAE